MYLELEAVFGSEDNSIPFNYSFTLNDPTISTPVAVNGSVYNKTGIVNLQAKVTFDVKTECAKCLKPLVRHASVPVRHILISHSENEDEDDLYITVEHMRLNLDELITEEVYLAMPSRFLCKPDCKGLCSMCGKDLNQESCSCAKPTDARWDALKDLF